ncbi:unnamed protein product, partial [marine sediment metagenome]
IGSPGSSGAFTVVIGVGVALIVVGVVMAIRTKE